MYSFTTRIRYSEVGADGTLRPDALINYLQDVSGMQSDAANVGTARLNAHDLAWILVTWDIYITRLPGEAEEVTVSTKPYRFRGCFGYRNFIIEDAQGEVIVQVNSLWAMIKKSEIAPIKVPEFVASAYEVEEPLPLPDKKRRIELPEDLRPGEPVAVTKGGLDSNRHLNNANYIRVAEEYFDTKRPLCNLQVEYRTAALYGEKLFPYIKEETDRTVVCLKSAKDEVYATVVASYGKDEETA